MTRGQCDLSDLDLVTAGTNTGTGTTIVPVLDLQVQLHIEKESIEKESTYRNTITCYVRHRYDAVAAALPGFGGRSKPRGYHAWGRPGLG